MEGAELYHLKGSYPSAAFMLHQVVELTFRAIELFFLGKETRSHEISIHLKYLERHLPHLRFRFPVHPTVDETLFKLLEDAYLGVRYGDRYQISKEQVGQLSKWAKDFVLFVTEIRGAFIKQVLQNSNIPPSISNKILEPNSSISASNSNNQLSISNNISKSISNILLSNSNIFMQNSNTFHKHEDGKNTESNDLKRIVSTINESLPSEAVLCLGKRILVSSRSSCFEPGSITQSLTHYDLLLIGIEQASDVLMLQGKINDLPDLQSKVNLLAHTLNEVRKALENGNSFFGQAVINSKVLYGEECVAPLRTLVTNTNHQRMNDDTAMVWYRRLDKAEAFLLTIAEVCYEDCFEISVTLIPQCLEQVCLGVIYVFLGYRPKIYNLNHLLSLCAMVSADFEDIIPRNSIEDKRFYKIIADGVSDIRYRDHVEYDMSTLQLLYHRCAHFVAKAKELGELRLKNL